MMPLSGSSRQPVEFRAATVWAIAICVVAFTLELPLPSWSQDRQTVAIRGHQQSLYIYGSPRGEPVIVSSGDGGWVHLGPHVAEFLAARGFFETIEHATRGTVVATGIPLGLTATPARSGRAGQAVGADNGYVFGTLLGMTETEIRRCITAGAIEAT